MMRRSMTPASLVSSLMRKTPPTVLRAMSTISRDELITAHPLNNVSSSIADKVGANLHMRRDHPLCTIKHRIQEYFSELSQKEGEPDFKYFEDLSPIVTKKQCFDDLLIPEDHVSRKATDTYYIDDERLLRTHMTSHDSTLLKSHKAFLVAGDVYRRDEIDASHYPVFHQIDGVRMFPELDPDMPREEKVAHANNDLKKTLEGMVRTIFGDVEMRWVEGFFPFTDPSIELEIFFNGDWLEVLGSGVLQQQIVRNAGKGEEVGWAFGMGVERLAMVLFDVPDIRLFWSEDSRFISQFKHGEITKFKPYSRYPPCYKDVAFWHNEDFHENNLCEIARDIAGDHVEQVTLIDEFVHPKTQKASKCYRVTYRHMDRNLTNDEVDKLQIELRARMESELRVELR